MAPSVEDKKAKLAGDARAACNKGDFEAAQSALADLKTEVRGDADDLAWVIANQGAVREAAEASAAAEGDAEQRTQFFPRIVARQRGPARESGTWGFRGPLASHTASPAQVDMKWRVDVSISTSHLERVMKPSVMIELTLSDGTIKSFEMNVEQFQKLRYDTARMLRNMQEIERHPIMRIVD